MVANSPYNAKNAYRNNPEVHLDPVAFNQAINNHGIRVSIEKTVSCPNYIGNIDDLHHDVNCTLCENGVVHFDKIECWALFQQNSLIKAYFTHGMFDPTQALLSFPTMDDNGVPIIVYHYDRIILLDLQERFYELINKSNGPVDNLRYQALDVYYVIGRDGTVYQKGSHFRINEDGNIEWIDGKPRPKWSVQEGIGEPFSVSYISRPVYRVMDHLHESRCSNLLQGTGRAVVKFPQLVIIKKDFYMTKKDARGIPIKPAVQEQEFTYNTVEPEADY